MLLCEYIIYPISTSSTKYFDDEESNIRQKHLTHKIRKKQREEKPTKEGKRNRIPLKTLIWKP